MNISYTSVNLLQEPATIQQRLLPYDLPSFESVEYSAMCRQAEAVGGDFYDFMMVPNGKLSIAIGDICGKGLAAALLMATLQATLRAEVSHVPTDLSALMTTINRLFHGASLEHLYSTLFYATFDPATRIVRYVNAGHPPPLIIRERHSDIEWLTCGGVPIGLFPDCTYTVGSNRLNPGDVMVAYTDGIIESPNTSGEQWGVKRLMDIVTAGETRRTVELNRSIMASVDAFSRGARERDDMALVTLRAI
jgi:phosphoserine phosphatase RsbU/P